MAVASFESFCADLCALMGVEAPSLEPGPTGVVGFSVRFQEATVVFMKPDETGEPGVLMMVVFGAPPDEVEPDVLRELMDSNYDMWGMSAPLYARNPVTREISLHYTFTLLRTDVHDVLNTIVNAGEVSRDWRKACFGERPARAAEGVA